MKKEDYYLRAVAIKILKEYEKKGGYLGKLLEREFKGKRIPESQKQFLTEVVNGVIRWKYRLDWIAQNYYKGSFKEIDNVVHQVLRVGLYQLLFLDNAKVHVVVNESTEFVKNERSERAGHLVNAIFRAYLREPQKFNPEFSDEGERISIWYSHPRWIVDRWIKRFGVSETEELCKANNQRPLLSIRLNTQKLSKQEFELWLTKSSVSWKRSDFIDNFYLLDHLPQEDKKTNHAIAVQDESAGLVSILVSPKPYETILDLCAAPGGKATFIAELMKDTGEVIAVDSSLKRLKLVTENAARLKLHSITAIHADARDVQRTNVDKILIDAPCSGLGTLRRKPDIRWNRRIENVGELSSLQYQILSHSASLVKSGGTIVYSTCSIEPEENEEIVETFLKNHSNYELSNATDWLPDKVCQGKYLYTFPHKQGTDGAFAARLKRIH